MEASSSTMYAPWHSEHGASEKAISSQKKLLDQNDRTSSSEKKEYNFIYGAKEVIFGGPLNILLACVPVGMMSYYLGWNDGVTFAFALLGIAPLAERLGFCTEQLAIHTNDSIGGLLNATFGNATEVIVGITALSKGLYRVVQLSLLGSVLSNLLLVLGTAFLFGGYKFKTQTFGKITAQISASILILSTMCLIFPAVLTQTSTETKGAEINFSRGVSLLLLVIYGALIYFQIISHRHLYEDLEGDDPDEATGSSNTKATSQTNGRIASDPESLVPLRIGVDDSVNGSASMEASNKPSEATNTPKPEDDDDEEEDILGFNYALVWLGIVTVFIAILSDAIAETIESAGEAYGISGVFLSTIVLPIIGNAAEHASAVVFGVKNKLDLSIGIAVGSACQISVFVIPFMVTVGWMIGKDMSLNFGEFESYTLFLTVILVTFAIKDGTSNYFVGVVMIVAYLIIAAAFLARNDQSLSSSS